MSQRKGPRRLNFKTNDCDIKFCYFFRIGMCPNSLSSEDTKSLKCWNCNNKPIYKCPKCETRSCSLECVKKHKIEADCDGLRDKTKYVPLQKFTDMDVVNDFRLLEDVSFQVDK